MAEAGVEITKRAYDDPGSKVKTQDYLAGADISGEKSSPNKSYFESD